MALADRLHKLPSEIRKMPAGDFHRLLAFYRIQHRQITTGQ